VIYLDSAAIVKLIRPEPETAALFGWLTEIGDTDRVTSTLAEIEVIRALRRTDPGRLAAVPAILAKLNQVPMDDIVRATATAYPDPTLRTLDAIHLASAHTLMLDGVALTAFVSYDKRLLAAADNIGLPTRSPT
jgi:uncharacterized protein